MTAILFDTLRLSRTLHDKGHFTVEQAEALAEALGDAGQDNLATKGDIGDIKVEFAKVRVEMAEMKADILKWVIGAIGFQTILILGAVMALLKLIH